MGRARLCLGTRSSSCLDTTQARIGWRATAGALYHTYGSLAFQTTLPCSGCPQQARAGARAAGLIRFTVPARTGSAWRQSRTPRARLVDGEGSRPPSDKPPFASTSASTTSATTTPGGVNGFALSVADLRQLSEAKHLHGFRPACTVDDLAAMLGSSLRGGLATDAADFRRRREVYGKNTLPKKQRNGFWYFVREALDDFTVQILIAAGAFSIVLDTIVGQQEGGGSGSSVEGVAILLAVVVVVMVTAVNNYQKEVQFEQLNALQADVTVRVLRDSSEVEVSTADLMVGDVLFVETGDIVPADGVVFFAHGIRVDESNLTGEADDIDKDAAQLPVLYSGSKVLEGLGKMLLTAVGRNSQQGAIMALATGTGMDGDEEEDGLSEETNLQRKLTALATQIGQFGLVAGVLTSLVASAEFTYDMFVVQGQAWSWGYLGEYLHYLILGITILVVAIPEGLPLAITIGLAFSVKRMLADNNLVRHLGAAETMGCATTICCDKTGTLTQNDMAVVRAYLGGAHVRGCKESRQLMGQRRKEVQQQQQQPYQQGSPVASLAALANSSGGSNSVDGAAAATAAAADASSGGSGEGGGGGSSTEPVLERTRSSVGIELVRAPSVVRRRDAVLQQEGIDARNVQLLCDAVAVNSTAKIVYEPDTGEWAKRGNRTECALLEFAEALGADIDSLRSSWQVMQIFPFTSERKRMSTLALQAGCSLDGMVCAKLFTKGAAELVLDMCDNAVQPDGQVAAMSEEDKQQLLASFGKDGRRMVCVAYRDLFLPTWHESDSPPQLDAGSAERHLTFLCMCGIEDPLRPQVKNAIGELQRAGITVRMLTGDNAITAFSIARQCGIVPKAAVLPPSVASGAGAGKAWKRKVLEWLSTETDECMDGPLASAFDARKSSSSNSNGNISLAITPPSASTTGATNGVGSSGGGGGAISSGATISSNGGATAAAAAMVGGSPGSGRMAATVQSSWDAQFSVMESSQFRDLILNADGSVNEVNFARIWPRLRVLARCTPLDKYIIVKACKGLPGEVVAMTGDGTNDAPALRLANVGFAMASGTSIAKDASDILLLDDNLDSIVQAVKWGRNVYAGATKFLQFQLTINVGAVATAMAGAFFLRDSPLTAVEMLWINLVMDSLASLALATETPTDDVLDQPPYATDASLMTPTVIKNIVGQTVYQLGVMYWVVTCSPGVLGYDNAALLPPGSSSVHYTMVFNAFVCMQLFNQVNARKLRDEHGVLEGITSDTLFLAILAAEAAVQVLLVQYGGPVVGCQPLELQQWAVCLGFGAAGLLVRQALRLVHVEGQGRTGLQ